jgi:hypothetical protein
VDERERCWNGKRGKKRREEVGGWGLVALSLSGAVLPTDPVMNRVQLTAFTGVFYNSECLNNLFNMIFKRL